MGFAVTADPQRFNEAADWFLKRVVLTKDEAERLGTEAGRRAFWIGGGLQLEQIQRVFDKVGTAIEQGTAFDDWRKQVKKELRNDAHAETVFRNATQRSLNAGRWRQMREPGVLAFRPYWLFDGIDDSRQSPICRKCNRTLLPAGHPWWSTHTPLLHHKCRSSIRNMRKLEAENRGVTNVPPVEPADQGFGLSPELEPDWKPDAGTHDAELIRELSRKQAEPRLPPTAPAKAPKEHDPKHWEGEYSSQYGEAAPNVAWGRAMLERGLDRSVADVAGELERLRIAGHPAVTSNDGAAALKTLGALDQNRPVRGSLQGEWLKSFVALSEHTRTVAPAPFKMLGVRLPQQAQSFFDLSLDKGVRQPSSWRVNRIQGRSYASPIAESVNVRIGASHSTYVHEIAHAIEFSDSRARQRSLAFLAARTKGEAPKRLADLTGLPYGDLEVTRPDKFVEPYIGKDYGTVATEVTSVGYELLSGGAIGEHTLASLARHDPEHLLFLLGQLAGR